ncbi:hypothetical protein BZA77DRAFT_314957 [Pyronema omphalodes]|nr:hypothetical protein BZA77DRAFT_314957 [Pyronema omphalodes]
MVTNIKRPTGSRRAGVYETSFLSYYLYIHTPILRISNLHFLCFMYLKLTPHEVLYCICIVYFRSLPAGFMTVLLYYSITVCIRDHCMEYVVVTLFTIGLFTILRSVSR